MAPNNKKDEEAARLARELFRLTTEVTSGESTTGESPATENTTDAITRALREQLDRLNAEREPQGNQSAHMQDTALFDEGPVTESDWDEAVDDTFNETGRDH